ncbi:5-hydroxytryptamine receptor 3A-like [Notolabrus celidotus]|uniref:5-hydroxytryptamine receptor 3A-like n=1 Tax=Notolabrus celidotus TaxID=1203425 RepID=UPI0014900AEC|nr:5-hydroxytryptamine receptor 3A-like [Notolabrus celidotus]
MIAAFLFLLLITGGFLSNFTAPPEFNQPTANQSSDDGEFLSNFTKPPELNQPTANQSSDDVHSCNKTYQDLFEHLYLDKKREKFIMTRPAKNHSKPTVVTLDVLLYAILDVREKEQIFVSYVWVDMMWTDEYIQWNPVDFCGIGEIDLPTKLFWKPDLTVEEMTEKDKATQSPFLNVGYFGNILLRNDMVLITTCRMQVYKFPFDTQSCNLTFKSVLHKAQHIQFKLYGDSKMATEQAKEVMKSQSDWLFINITLTNQTIVNFYINQSTVVATITMQRRSVLYIVNFIVPVLLFLCLDLASFMISERGGEKLSFKVTVLLAVTVMQLILNEILPSSSDKIPLIAIYCIGVFGLMLMSLLETIVVMYLLEKDSEHQDSKTDADQSLCRDCNDKQEKVKCQNCFRDIKKWTHCLFPCDASPGEMPSELLPVSNEASSSHLTEDSYYSEKEGMKALSLPLSSTEEERQTGYWERMTKKINRVFFIFHITSASLFLAFMSYSWIKEDLE